MITDTINDAVTMAGGAGALLANRYRVVRQLGQGGMGSVWLAEDTQLDNKLFAIKMLPSILVSTKRAYRQLKDEALVAMQLVHPNIVQIRAFEENNGNPFLVMDYIDGQTLDDYLAEHTGTTGVPPVDVLRILRPIAAALDYAHAKGVVHRDVKPGNVMIAKDGTPYILDFGIAREIQETMTRVTGKLSSGTLLYMSPEQLMAQDIYSFAVMAYECLKGEPPFSHGQIEFQIMNKQPDPPPGGTQLVASVMAGLAKKPEDRPATCAAVLEGNNLTQRRREAESQGGRARSPSGPHGNGFSRVEHVERVDGVGGARRPAEPVVRRVPTPPQSGGARSRATAQTTEGPRSRATVTGILAAALIAVLAGGAWWFVNARTARSTGTTGVPPVAANNTSAPAPRPIQPKAGPTDADVKVNAVEAGTQEELIKGVDDEQGYFKERKGELTKTIARARAHRSEHLLAEAALAEAIRAQSNAVMRAEQVNGRDWQQEALDFTQIFGTCFAEWVQQWCQKDTPTGSNEPPYSVHVAQTIANAAQEVVKKQQEILKEPKDADANIALAGLVRMRDLCWLLAADPRQLAAADLLMQTNAYADVSRTDGFDWQKDAYDHTRVFRSRFPAWAQEYEQKAQSDTNMPPFTKEQQAEVAALAADVEKKQAGCIKDLVPPDQLEAIRELQRIIELLPPDQNQRQQQQQQQQQQNQNKDQDKDLDQQQDELEQQQEQKEQKAQVKERRDSQTTSTDARRFLKRIKSSAHRAGFDPGLRGNSSGFRLCRSAEARETGTETSAQTKVNADAKAKYEQQANEEVKQKVVDSLEGKKDQGGEYWARRLSMADAYYARGMTSECRKIYDEFFKTVTKPGADMLDFYTESGFRWAQICAREKHYDEAVRMYGKLLDQPLPEDRWSAVAMENVELLLRLAETITADSTNQQAKKRAEYLAQATKLVDKLLRKTDLALVFGRAIAMKSHIEILRGNYEKAQGLVNDYMPQLAEIHAAIQKQDTDGRDGVLRVSPMPECRYLLAEAMWKVAQEEAKKPEPNEDLIKDLLFGVRTGGKRNGLGAYNHAINVFAKYPESKWAASADKMAKAIVDFVKTRYHVELKTNFRQTR